ncbi:MAG: hypothetical protein K6F32_07335 [Bacilli bacterium]|nr:hypothetical protein [Bacilli bacterium]
MNKKYFIHEIKSHLTLVIIFLVVTCSIAAIAGFSVPYYNTVHHNAYQGQDMAYQLGTVPAMIGFSSVCALLLATFMPLSTFHYRLKANEADLYLQTPFKPNRFRWQRILFGLGLVLALTTVLFWFEILVFSLSSLRPLPESYYLDGSGSWVEYTRASLNYGYIALAFVYILFGAAAQYFISSFAVAAGKNVVYSLIGLALFQGLLGSFPAAIFGYITNFIPDANYFDYTYPSLCLNLSMVNPGVMIFTIFYPLIQGRQIFSGDWYPSVLIIGQVLYFVLAGGLAAYLFLAKEPSGEHAGKLGFHPRWFLPLYHIGNAITGLTSVSGLSVIGSVFTGAILSSLILGLVLWGFRYYLILALCKASFKFKKSDWIWFASVMAFVLLTTIAGIVGNALI